jgi:hypothetical protein
MTAREYKFKATTNIDESYQRLTRPSRTATKLMIAQSPEQHKQRIAFSSTASHKKSDRNPWPAQSRDEDSSPTPGGRDQPGKCLTSLSPMIFDCERSTGADTLDADATD